MENIKKFEKDADSGKNQNDLIFPHTVAESIEFYRKRLIETDVADERVMSRFNPYPTNRCKPMLVERITMDRLIKKHGNNGYICISAYRSDLDKDTNDKNTKRLIIEIKQSKYRYLPIYGGYRAESMGEEGDFEPSIIVFNYDKEGEEQDWAELQKMGIEWCGRYDQSSVLIKAPNNPPVWLDRNGKSKDETDLTKKSYSEQELFTSFISLEKVDIHKKQYLWQEYVRKGKEKGLKKFDIDEFEKYKKEHWKDAPVYIDIKRIEEDEIVEGIYVNPSPCDRNEMIGRHYSGEILIMLELFED